MRCKALNILNLLGNFLHKAMPSDQSIVGSSGFENLQLLSLTGCQLTSQLSIWLSKIKNLEVLYLNSNRITGSIHGWLSSLPMLFWLHLCDNLISGEFPKELCSLPTLVSPTPLADNTSLDLPIYATVPSSLVEFSFLFKLGRTIVVSNNSLSGHIPIEIRHLKNLQALRLDHNKLLGKIPDQMSNLTDLEMLDLSENHLFGEIPVSLANLHFLYEFSIVNNNLQGSIPSGTQLQSFDASAYEGNPGLCGPPLPNQGPHITVNKDDTDIQHEENVHSIPWLHINVVLGFITRFWGYAVL
ncbi:Tyrosine-sulfated glycopeptide receptor 1 [Morella rubra]|uniref:Tyrosine-sulfated glycopeptide receptor 1 n=1 Tax=Morella rubra TaxID=262757 RepID=A0A6A1WLZ1_9ROSI|nr:Tyrosine-sulfated glycopeptide receptor 1 [Morella rubra]